MSDIIKITSPIKGVVKIRGYQDHTPDAAVDALNVVPFDTGGRFRVGQRMGISKASAVQLGNGAQSVQLLMAVTRALDPTLIAPGTLQFSDPFTFSNGYLAAVDTNFTVRAGSSTAHIQYAAMTGSNTTTAGWFVSSNAVTNGVTVAGGTYYAALTTTLTLGSSYLVRFKLYTPSGTLSNVALNNISLLLRVPLSGTDPRGAVEVLFVYSFYDTSHYFLSQVRIVEATANDSTTTTTLASVTNNTGVGYGIFSNSTPMNIEVQYVAGRIQVFANSNLITSANVTYTAGNGAGLGFSSNLQQSVTASLDDFQVYAGTALASYRQTDTVAVCGGNIYVAPAGANLAITSGGVTALQDSGKPSGTPQYGLVYFCDGLNARVLDLNTKLVSAWTPTAGLETNATLAKFTQNCTWRGRIVLAAATDNPQNFIMSKVGDPLNFDYTDQTSAAALAGNAARAGYIGEPVIALIPASDDTLFIGGDHNLWLIRGDLADGGSIDLISDAIGILGPDAWTKAPDGTIYFLGTGGLFRMAAGGATPENISGDKWNEYFKQINRGLYYPLLEWDRDAQQLYIFLTPVNTATPVHLLYDARLQCLWPLTYPATSGPVCAYLYDGDGPTDRNILLGGRDGYIRKLDYTATNDDGTAISSYIYLGPLKNDDVLEQVIQETNLIFARTIPGVSSFNCVATMQAGPTVEKAFESPTRSMAKTYTAFGPAVPWTRRLSGVASFLKLSNTVIDKSWAFEKATVSVEASGRVRRLA